MKPMRGVILPVVLFMLLLVGLLAAMFSFRVHADLSSTQVNASRLQTRLAAEAGVDRAKMLLAASPFDPSQWYDNPEMLNRILVWADGVVAEEMGTNREYEETMAYRYSVVADDPTDDKDYIRFGITDEASKLNLNLATESQLLKLMSLSVGEDSEINPQRIVDAILDWRDSDTQPRGEAGDTEGVYYSKLDNPYRVRNGDFVTVEELLLVKDVTPQILYGEDYDRNGLLTPNEDDGDRSFPLDNQDGTLNRGLYPYLTTFSYETNVSNENRPRVNLLGKEETLRAELALVFPDEPEVIDACITAIKGPKDPQGPGGAGGPGGSTGDPQNPTGGTKPPPGGTPPPGGNPPPSGPGGSRRSPQPNGSRNPGQPQTDSFDASVGKAGRLARLQQEPEIAPPSGNSGSNPTRPTRGNQPSGNPRSPALQPGSPGSPDEAEGEGTEGEGTESPEQDKGNGTKDPTGGPKSGSAGTPKINSPADLLLDRKSGEPVDPPPFTGDQLAVLMDRTTAKASKENRIVGLINVNTATRPVLECLEELTGEQIEQILALRDRIDPVTRSTTAWLYNEGVLDAQTFAKVAPKITARGQQFMIESLGFADHIGMVTRLQVMVDRVGPILQTIYYRDISSIGGSFPIREEDKEKRRVR